MVKSGTNTKSNKKTPKAPKITESVKKLNEPINYLTKEEKDLTIKLIETAEYYQDYMLTDFDRKVIKDIKRKILK